MTKREYKDYQRRVERELKGVEHVSTGSCPGCSECDHADSCTDDECSRECAASDCGFSWHACESCGSRLGGDRYAAHGRIAKDDTLIHFEVCADCVDYLNYGRLDDETMLDVEDASQ